MHSWKLEAEAKPGIGYRRMLCSKCGIWMKQTKSENLPRSRQGAKVLNRV